MLERDPTLVQLFNAQAGQCFYCGTSTSLRLRNKPTEATKDHITPKSKGGLNSHFNYVMSCRQCNEEKADKPFLEFYLRKKQRKPILKVVK
jgi:5-methylcytosine-specific restriction endonuclease McrA